eukprot:NODE_1731_length_861_cov_92.535714_g1363_i0.p1 GENE.NODE_1731_length_861_cov_92.535714_g1363_i0~~NODE_1731_length_861_cov_92.535714_g1363_i0.p1  ORF type:complete len:181 (-),score=35.44 NODE_1731_length_861_cov_92.535714_g1363_i0:257-799(-)
MEVDYCMLFTKAAHVWPALLILAVLAWASTNSGLLIRWLLGSAACLFMCRSLAFTAPLLGYYVGVFMITMLLVEGYPTHLEHQQRQYDKKVRFGAQALLLVMMTHIAYCAVDGRIPGAHVCAILYGCLVGGPASMFVINPYMVPHPLTSLGSLTGMHWGYWLSITAGCCVLADIAVYYTG